MTGVEAAELIVAASRVYLALGAAFSIPFVLFLVQRIDPSVRGSTWGFRLILVPGTVLLWPLLLVRVVGGRTTPVERNAHREASRARAEGPARDEASL